MNATHDTEHEPLMEGEEEPPPGVRTMAIVRWVLVGLMAVFAAGSILYAAGVFEQSGVTAGAPVYYCPMHPSVVQDHPGSCPICAMDLVLREADEKTASAQQHAHPAPQGDGAYYCPMHPEVTSDDPKATCPKCGGMQLVPVPKPGATPKDSDVPGLDVVELSDERIQLSGLRTTKVEREKFSGEISTVGVVSASEAGLAQVTTRYSGWIEELRVAETGKQVKKGQVLATVYSPELLTSQHEFLHIRQQSNELRQTARRRLELLGISETEIDELERSGAPMRAVPIRSPASGFVTSRGVVQGAFVQPGTKLFEITDLTTVWVLADIYESSLSRVAVGQSAALEVAALPGQARKGLVQFIYPSLDPNTRTLRVRIELKNSDFALRPGMFGRVRIGTGETHGLVIPAEALVDTGEFQYVFLAEANGRFVPRRVEPGMRSADKIEIRRGLNEGETVVTTANFLLDSESRLRAAIHGAPSTNRAGSTCDSEFDASRFPEKAEACRACEVQHRGMGSMVDDCKNAIPKPWK